MSSRRQLADPAGGRTIFRGGGNLAEKPILSAQSIRDFFRDLLARAIENQRAQVQPFTELYLVNLLHEFLASEALYVQSEDGTWQQKPLAFLLKEALDEAGPARLRLLRRLGDTGLVRLYERWLKTGSDRLASLLVRQGVVPRRGFVQ